MANTVRFTDDEIRAAKRALGYYHRDKDISDEESAVAYAAYQKISAAVKPGNTTRKVKK